MGKKYKICFVVPVEYVVDHFLLNHLRYLSKTYDTTVVLNSNQPDLLSKRGIDVKVVKIPFSRGIDFFNDIYCFFKLFIYLRKNKFDALHSVTPKVGCLAMVCSLIARVPRRVHIFTGQVWADKKGFGRFFFKRTDTITALCATHCLVDSPSQMAFLLENKVIKSNKSRVFGLGSIAGVDLEKFKLNVEVRHSIRRELAIPEDALCLTFIGRLSIGKGIYDLVEGFSQINNPNLFLLIVGPDEGKMVNVIKEKYPSIENRLRFVGYTYHPENYMSAADVLCLPSYKEGFGSVIIEAAAIGLPAIASNIYGISDAVIDGQTGILHAPGNIDEIKTTIERIANDKTLRLKLGTQAYNRVVKDFDCQLLTQAWCDFYKTLLADNDQAIIRS